MSIYQDVMYKSMATEWVDFYWEQWTPWTPEFKYEIERFENMEGRQMNDNLPYDADPVAVGAVAAFMARRIRMFDTKITFKGLGYLFRFADNPGKISMLVAAVVHTFRANDVENTRLITYQWLKTCFEGKHLTHEAGQVAWDKQKNSYDHVVDRFYAFELMTPEESTWWANAQASNDAAEVNIEALKPK